MNTKVRELLEARLKNLMSTVDGIEKQLLEASDTLKEEYLMENILVILPNEDVRDIALIQQVLLLDDIRWSNRLEPPIPLEAD